VGEHATQHLRYDAPLSADVEAFARTVSGYVRVVPGGAEMGGAAVEAIRAAFGPPGQVATLIVPADYSWNQAGEPGGAVAPVVREAPAAEPVREAARILRTGETTGILLDGTALLSPALEAAGKLAAATGARIFANRYGARTERGAGRFAPHRIPYFPEAAEAALAGLRHMILVEARPPVSFFAYPGRRSLVTPADCACFELATPAEDGRAALGMLVDECGAGSAHARVTELHRCPLPRGAPLTPENIGRAMSALLPDHAILSDEMISSGEPVSTALTGAPPHDHLPVSGGSIGQGLPVAVGAALACPGRKVIALEADGSGMYTLQSLWTMTREGLDVVTVIFANRRYRILDIEIRRTGAARIGRAANDMIDIARPTLDWVKLAEAQGVPAARATTADEFIVHFRTAVNEPGPRLIEAVI
jgi:acetolactate synthase-1/2/3 large subunit